MHTVRRLVQVIKSLIYASYAGVIWMLIRCQFRCLEDLLNFAAMSSKYSTNVFLIFSSKGQTAPLVFTTLL